MKLGNPVKWLAVSIIVLVIGTGFWLNKRSLYTAIGQVATHAKPPVTHIQHYSFSNAPSVSSPNALWDTNLPVSVSQNQVIASTLQTATLTRSNTQVAALKSASKVTFKSATQKTDYTRLQLAVGDSLQVYLRPGNAAPMQVKGYPLAKAVPGTENSIIQKERAARIFLKEYASLFQLQDPDKELKLSFHEIDQLERSNFRFSQQYLGLSVWPGELSVHFDPQGNIDIIDGAYVPTPQGIETQPQITVSDAEMQARQKFPAGANGLSNKPELLIYAPVDKEPRLAWKFEIVHGIADDWIIMVDANNGSVLQAVNRCMSVNVPGQGVDVFGISRSLNVWQEGTTYYMVDASKAMFNASTFTGVIKIEDARNATESQVVVGNQIKNIYHVTSVSPASWSNPDAVSAAVNFSEVFDYYRQHHGRNSYDNQGGDISAVVRIGNFQNAFWHPAHKMMIFGNADRYVASLDVVGHEMTHGVINSIGTNGVLVYENQPGALNEAFADIFGEMIEAKARGTNDWLLGSDLNVIIRSMSNPENYDQPTRMSQFDYTTSDSGGVHKNSGIINRSFYLLAVGLPGAVGLTDAERIYYRCLTQHMKPQSQFIDARLGCIASAEVLFGTNSIQAIKTAEAFDVVEIFASPASAEMPSTVNAAVNAADSVMFIQKDWLWNEYNLCRRETAKGDSSTGTEIVSNVKLSRPSLSGNGNEMVFVDANNTMCYRLTYGGSVTNVFATGVVHSVAASPDGRYWAFVFNDSVGNPTNQLYILDTLLSKTSTIILKTPVQDGSPISNISYADALAFSPDGQYLVYDALSKITRADGKLRNAWSVFSIDMVNLNQKMVLPPDEEFQIGNPAFGKTSSRYIVFDAQYTNGNSVICTLDLYQGTLGVVGLAYAGLGYPCFNGDDTSVVYANQDVGTYSGRSIYYRDLSVDKMSSTPSDVLWLRDAKMAVVYRRGTYSTPNTPPSITLTSPTNNAVFTSPATIPLQVSTSDLGGTVTQVVYYIGSRVLGIDTPPFGANWNNVSAGNYTVFARAYDNMGATTTTGPVKVSVRPASQNGGFRTTGARGFELSVKVKQSGLYRLEVSTNLLNWIPLGTFESVSNLNYYDSAASNNTRRFYRAVKTP